eukprot:NODE_1777_length_1410_cov_48.534901_g1606_i0.p2 GENE.NODE_1777_length_1410_cov_48.534901_g1606_i0~~NODE_1777_length_1410_cov_48.534901_g1606_i0.p2  ORF type:complete len:230 (+),score=30.58 NODE_1777_length_1410_cov_48.534901_g1606_i0:184-873(+)
MLWVDKHRPKDLDQMEVHRPISVQLKGIVLGDEFPHLLFCGPSGAGKKTRIMALLRHVFGNSVDRLKTEQKPFKVTESKTLEVCTLSSQHHIEMNPSDLGIYDRVVIMTLLKEIAESAPLDGNNQRAFKVVVLTEVDTLSRGAQQALRRTMEKYITTCRLILCATSSSRIIEPLRSRCFCVRVPAPDAQTIQGVLEGIARKEGLTNVPPPLLQHLGAVRPKPKASHSHV